MATTKHPKRKRKQLHLFSTMEHVACGKAHETLPGGSIATFVTDVTCPNCKKTSAYAAALRAWNEYENRFSRPGVAPMLSLERRVALMLERCEDLAAQASLAGIFARADVREPARALLKVLQDLEKSLGQNSPVQTALEDFLKKVAPTPAFADGVHHGG
jgi:hypothetical protein